MKAGAEADGRTVRGVQRLVAGFAVANDRLTPLLRVRGVDARPIIEPASSGKIGFDGERMP